MVARQSRFQRLQAADDIADVLHLPCGIARSRRAFSAHKLAKCTRTPSVDCAASATRREGREGNVEQDHLSGLKCCSTNRDQVFLFCASTANQKPPALSGQ